MTHSQEMPLRPAWLLRRPSAFLPIAMSLAAIGLIAWFVATFGVVEQTDEGTPARVFQLLLAAQVPIVACFAIRWLPRSPEDRDARRFSSRSPSSSWLLG
jgi:ABC-type transport system involved in cytochrome c biogenesis permease subunit